MAVLTAVFKVFMNLSASPFACGHRGVIFLCSNPAMLHHIVNEFAFIGGPLSVFSASGNPICRVVELRLSL